MNRQLIRYGGILIALAAAAWSASAQEDAALLDELIVKSGLQEQLAQIPGHLEAQLEHRRAAVPAEKLETVAAIMREHFSAEKIREDMKAHLKETLQPEDIRKVLEWLDSPLGMKLTKLEEDAASPEVQMQMQAQAHELFSNEARVEMVQRFDQAIGGTEGTIQMIKNMAHVDAVMEVACTGAPMALVDEARTELEASLEDQREMFAQSVVLSLLYSYQTVTDDELKRYVEFAESDIGQKYHRSMMAGMDKAFSNRMQAVAEGIKEHFAAKEEPAAEIPVTE